MPKHHDSESHLSCLVLFQGRTGLLNVILSTFPFTGSRGCCLQQMYNSLVEVLRAGWKGILKCRG